MKKAIAASAAAIFVGYLGSALGYEMMNWPELGPILSIVIMGSVIICTLEKGKWLPFEIWMSVGSCTGTQPKEA